MQSFTITIPLTITFAMGTPQTHCVKLEIPPLVVPTPGLPVIQVPVKRSRNHPCTVSIDGAQRHVSGAVAGVLARLEAGEREVDMRAECSARLAAEVPEVFRMLKRLEHRKTLAKREWWGL